MTRALALLIALFLAAYSAAGADAAVGGGAASGLGVWQGEPVAPWDWQGGTRIEVKEIRRPERRPPLKVCRIKGNVSYETGERIYHVPGGKYYSRTRINPSRGERWFCSEAKARAAGWRRSRR